MFLNIPYDDRFENLLLAYIAGISAFGFAPRATLEIPFSQRRLERIVSLIASSQYSVHDMCGWSWTGVRRALRASICPSNLG